MTTAALSSVLAEASVGRLPGRGVAAYAAGSITGGVYGTLPGLLLLPYLTDVLGMSAVAAGAVVLLPSLWVALVTPHVGRRSDRGAGRLAHRRTWILAGGSALSVAFPLAFATLFRAGGATETVVVLVDLLASATLYACFQGPYMALAAEITNSPAQRTRLMGRRVAVLAVTILVVGALGPAVHAAVGGVDGYRLVALGAGLLMLVGTVWTARGTPAPPRARTVADNGDDPTSFGIREALAVPALRNLLANYALQGVATGASLAGLVFVATYVLHDAAAASVIFFALFMCTILAVPVWESVGARYGKRACLAGGSVIYVIGTGALLAIRDLSHPVVYALAGLIGIGYAAMQVFPMAMLPDVTEATASATGRPMEAGLFAGLWTSVETGSLALGSALFALLLAVGGYKSAVGGVDAVQTHTAQTAMIVGFAGLPALFMALSLVPLSRYELAHHPESGHPIRT